MPSKKKELPFEREVVASLEPKPADAQPAPVDVRPIPEPTPDAAQPDRAAPAAATDPAAGQRKPRGFLARLFGRRVDEPEGAPYAPEDVTPEPPVGARERVVESRPIRPPYSSVRIVFDDERNAYRYEVLEPPLTSDEREAFDFIRDSFLRSLDVDLGTLDRDGARRYLANEYEKLAKRHSMVLSPLSRARVGYYLERDFLGFGVIDAMMNDPSIEDVSCDGPALPVFIYHRRYESVRSNVTFATDESLDGFVMQLVQRSGRHISVADPLVDATLPDGSRLQASLSREVTTRGSTFTIRRFRKDPLTPTDLLSFETLSPEMMAYWWLVVENGASAIICGGTASGKTTSLNALSLFIPPQKKIVSIEDTRELNIPHENWIPGVTRAGGVTMGSGENGKRLGEVDMFDLLRAALRQRPEYLLLGEVRGAEAYVLFQAMATGHTVYSTMHADSVQSAVHRLESKPLEIPRNMLSSLDIFCVQGEVRSGGHRVRKMREIVELTGVDPRTGELLTNRVFSWDQADGAFKYSGASFVLGRIAEVSNMSDAQLRAEFDRRVGVLQGMQRKGIRDISSVSRIIVDYSIDPERTLQAMVAP